MIIIIQKVIVVSIGLPLFGTSGESVLPFSKPLTASPNSSPGLMFGADFAFPSFYPNPSAVCLQ